MLLRARQQHDDHEVVGPSTSSVCSAPSQAKCPRCDPSTAPTTGRDAAPKRAGWTDGRPCPRILDGCCRRAVRGWVAALSQTDDLAMPCPVPATSCLPSRLRGRWSSGDCASSGDELEASILNEGAGATWRLESVLYDDDPSASIAKQMVQSVEGATAGSTVDSISLATPSGERLPWPNVPAVPRAWGWTWDAEVRDRPRLLRCERCAGAANCFGPGFQVMLRGLHSFAAHTARSNIRTPRVSLSMGQANIAPGGRPYRACVSWAGLGWDGHTSRSLWTP